MALALVATATPSLADPFVAPVVQLNTSGLTSRELDIPEADRLRGWLLTRLLDEGYAIAPDPQQSDLVLEVASSPHGFSVEVSARKSRGLPDDLGYSVERGSLAVVSVEILHRAVLALEQAKGGLERAPRPRGTTVSLRIVGAEEPQLAAWLHEEVALSLSRQGATLMPPSRNTDLVACVKLEPARILAGVGASPDTCLASSEAGARSEQAQAMVAAVRERVSSAYRTAIATANGLGTKAPVTVTAIRVPGVPPKPASVDRALLGPADTGRSGAARLFELGLAGGVLVRGGGSDPWLSLRFGRKWRPGTALRVQSELSFSSAGSLDIVEPALLAGFTLATRVTTTLRCTFGLLAGTRLHRYHYDEQDRGWRVNWLLALPLEIATSGVFSPELGVETGLSGPPRDHEIRGRSLWQRGAVFLGVRLGVRASL